MNHSPKTNYDPQVDDYVIWNRPNGDIEEGWVYFKGDPIDNEKRVKDGWNSVSRYITIETNVRDKPNCMYSSGQPIRHKKIHTLLLCNDNCWHELEYVKNRRGENDNKLVDMYKSQDRPLDIDSYGAIPPRY